MFTRKSSKSARIFVCPGCGADLGGAPERRAQVITCTACGTKASVAEWTQWPTGNSLVGRAGQPPPRTKIRRENVSAGSAWDIPAHGKFGFFMFFGVFWCFVTALLSGGFLIAFLSGREIKGDGPAWLLIPFFAIFWIIGLTVLYFGVRQKWMTHQLTVEDGELVLRREMFGRSKEKKLLVSEIRSVEQKEFYQKNYQPVYGIEIKGMRGKLRFGSALDDAEKAWLVADLREAVFGPTEPARSAADEIKPERAGNGPFSVMIPHSRQQIWPFAIAFLLMGVIFPGISLTFLNDSWKNGRAGDPIGFRMSDGIFNVLGHGMQLLFLILGMAFLAVGVAIWVHLIRSHRAVRMLEGNSVEIVIRTYRHNLVWKEKTYPRERITDIRASQSGSSGTTVMKRIELIAEDEVIKLASWIEAEAADAVVAQVRPCL